MQLLQTNMYDFGRMVKDVRTAILPIGALEEHGPHLPLGLDAMHAWELAKRTSELHPAWVAPPLFYGMCRSTSQHPGTVGISGNTLRSLVRDVGLSLWDQGIKALCLLTGHAGGTHQAALVEAGEGLLGAAPMQVAVVCVLDLVDEIKGVVQCPGDSHAGEVETSLAMHLWPDLVKGSAPEEYPTFPKYILVKDKKEHWPGGVWGDPSLASPEKGKKIFEAEAQSLARILGELEQRIG